MKVKNIAFRKVVNEIELGGSPCDLGCSMSKARVYKERAYHQNRLKKACIVAEWVWMDIRMKDIKKSWLNEILDEIHPSFLVVKRVIEDDAERFKENTYMRTSMLVCFHPSCIFETENTSYILAGSGKRCTISIEQAGILFGDKKLFMKK